MSKEDKILEGYEADKIKYGMDKKAQWKIPSLQHHYVVVLGQPQKDVDEALAEGNGYVGSQAQGIRKRAVVRLINGFTNQGKDEKQREKEVDTEFKISEHTARDVGAQPLIWSELYTGGQIHINIDMPDPVPEEQMREELDKLGVDAELDSEELLQVYNGLMKKYQVSQKKVEIKKDKKGEVLLRKFCSEGDAVLEPAWWKVVAIFNNLPNMAKDDDPDMERLVNIYGLKKSDDKGKELQRLMALGCNQADKRWPVIKQGVFLDEKGKKFKSVDQVLDLFKRRGWDKIRYQTEHNVRENNRVSINPLEPPIKQKQRLEAEGLLEGMPGCNFTVLDWLNSPWHFYSLAVTKVNSHWDQNENYSPVCKRCFRIMKVEQHYKPRTESRVRLRSGPTVKRSEAVYVETVVRAGQVIPGGYVRGTPEVTPNMDLVENPNYKDYKDFGKKLEKPANPAEHPPNTGQVRVCTTDAKELQRATGTTDFHNFCADCHLSLREHNALVKHVTRTNPKDPEVLQEVILTPGNSVVEEVIGDKVKVRNVTGFYQGNRVEMGNVAYIIEEREQEGKGGLLTLTNEQYPERGIELSDADRVPIKIYSLTSRVTDLRTRRGKLVEPARKGDKHIMLANDVVRKSFIVLQKPIEYLEVVNTQKQGKQKWKVVVSRPLQRNRAEGTDYERKQPGGDEGKLQLAYYRYKFDEWKDDDEREAFLENALREHDRAHVRETDANKGFTKAKEPDIHVSDIETRVQNGVAGEERREVMEQEIEVVDELMDHLNVPSFTGPDGEEYLSPQKGQVRVVEALDSLKTQLQNNLDGGKKQFPQEAILNFDSSYVKLLPNFNDLDENNYPRGQWRKMRQSNILLTFVLHRAATDDDHGGHIVHQFKRAMQYYFATDDLLEKAIQFNKAVAKKAGETPEQRDERVKAELDAKIGRLDALIARGKNYKQVEGQLEEFDMSADTDDGILETLQEYRLQVMEDREMALDFEDEGRFIHDDVGIFRSVTAKKKDDPYNYPAADYEKDTYWTHVEYVQASGGVEIGPVSRMYHFHVRLSIVHWSRIMFDYYVMSNWFMRAFKGEEAQEQNFKLLDQNGHPWIRDSEQWYAQAKLHPQDDANDVVQRYIVKTATQSDVMRAKRRAPNVDPDPARRQDGDLRHDPMGVMKP